MTTAREARAEIAAVLEAAALEDVTVYAEPPDQLQSPSVVIGPGSPYREPSAICSERVNLRLTCSVARSAGRNGMDELDDLIDLVRAALGATAYLTWLTVETIGLTAQVGGTDHLLAAIGLRADLPQS